MEGGGALKRKRRSYTDYKIAIFVPLSVELTPLQAILDAVHEDLQTNHYRNAYVLGELNKHNIVIAPLPSIGNNDSGVVASQLLHDFPSIQFGLLVGIAGGVPGTPGGNEIRLGDVVVSEPKGNSGGVVQFDRGKNLQGRQDDLLQVTGHLNKPSSFLTTTVKKLAALHQQQGNKIQHFISDMLSRNPFMKIRFGHPGSDCDNLFESDYEHVGGHTCSECDATRVVQRLPRSTNETVIHYGTIGSSNAVIKNALERDRLGHKYDLLSVEMEAAGLMDTLPCLVVRGICDYADSHKNKDWQPYAAAVAAAYTKELLLSIPPSSTLLAAENLTIVPVKRSNRIIKTAAELDLEQTPEDRLLQSLAFSRMNARRWNIQEPLPHTCEWLFQHPSFMHWVKGSNSGQERDQFLWIKGKPGSGKSTLMNTAFQWVEKHRPSEANISYFFNARALGDLEKSTLGLYRSMVYQLLDVDSESSSQELFWQMFQSKVKNEKSISWTPSELKNFLVRAMRATTCFTVAVNIFIDALDEGEDEDIRQMVGFLEDLGSAAHLTHKPLRICLSSRHYPHISARNCLDLIVEDQRGHEKDIGKFVKNKLMGEPGTELDALAVGIRRKAAGIFLWAVLVVPMLNKVYDDGGSVADMTSSLRKTPDELNSLFSQLMETFDDNRDECLALLQWTSFSREPLSPQQLFLAIQATLLRPKADCNNMTPERLRRYLLSRSRGLTEITKSEPYTVQFIHETVRDFLRNLGLGQIVRNTAVNVVGECHEKLKTGCEQYIRKTAPLINVSGVLSMKDFLNKKNQVEDKAPLLRYAAAGLFRHAETAAAHDIDQRAFMEQYSGDDRTSFVQWIRAYNLLHLQLTPELRPSRSLETNWHNVLGTVAQQGLERLARILIEGGADVSARNKDGNNALILACEEGHEGIVRLLIEQGIDVNAQGYRFVSALQTACFMGHEQIVRLLIAKGADVNAEGDLHGSAIEAALRGSHYHIARLLRAHGAVDSS